MYKYIVMNKAEIYMSYKIKPMYNIVHIYMKLKLPKYVIKYFIHVVKNKKNIIIGK